MESLEGRTLLDGSTPWRPTTSDLSDIKNGPMANLGQDLVNLHQNFLRAGGTTTGLAAKFPLLQFRGDSVGVDVRGTGDFTKFLTSLRNLGFTVTISSPAYATVEGFVPIAQLPTLAQLPQTLAGRPTYKPITRFVGNANNQAEASLNANIARQTTGLDGSGVTVGVISDSYNANGVNPLPDVTSGDLPANVLVLKEGPAGASDEGRAMLENIYDIAPGASLAFATGFGGPLNFADSIRALAIQGNSKVIVDDLGYFNEPFFQDGFISQAINSVVTNNNVTYVSAAGNNGTQAGYLSNFRGVQATVPGAGAGRYMNFAPSGTAVTQLPVTTTVPNVRLMFQFDQPFAFEQPAGSTAAVTSNVEFYVLDANGNVVASGTQNNVATQLPLQNVTIPSAGTYTIAIKVTSGADPGNVQFTNFGDQGEFYVSQQFGSAGGTFYPSSYGHSTAANTVGVGAVPWWATTPFLGTNPLNSEPFSSSGPGLYVRNPDGSPISGAVAPTLNPVVTGPDGGNTTFFGFTFSTANPPFPAVPTPPHGNPPIPGNPATQTNLSQNLPSFFGTSSASPNVAAVAALMKQRIPSLTQAQVVAGLRSGARPMNGTPSGTWNPQSGYGLVDAVAALAAIDALRVVSTTPGNGATVTTTPNQIVFTFNKPVDINTVTRANLAFQSVPSSLASLNLGQPFGVDNARFPTVVAFPFSFTLKPNQSGNGRFSYILQGNVTSQDGKVLQPSAGAFTINDTVAPKVANATLNGRIVTVRFNEAMAASTITSATVFVARLNPDGSVAFNLSSDPRSSFSYNAATQTATLDYSGLSQLQLPTGTYAIIVKSGRPLPGGGFEPGVTDVVGNKLDGFFSGVFPSGNGTVPTDFVQNLGRRTLVAPQITSFNLTAASDSGIKGDENTNINQPTFVGQVSAGFPGTVSGLTILAQFNSLHGGVLDLNSNGRGFTGSFDVQVTTDATGSFRLQTPFLPEGFTRVRLVVIASPDSPPLPGLSSSLDRVFRIDKTAPNVQSASIAPGGATLPFGAPNSGIPLAALSTLSLNVVDPMSPRLGALATPPQVFFPALDPATASNISNYQLINLDDATDPDKSRFISTATFLATASDFVSTPSRTLSSDPYFGRIDLSFAAGLNRGRYQFIARSTSSKFGGLTDAAANPLDDTTVVGQGTKDFVIYFNLQPEPVYVVSISTDVQNAQGNTLLPRSYYEINPRAGDIVSAPPTTFNIDFSNPLPAGNYTNAVQLLRTANVAGAAGDGEFGTLGVGGLGSSGTGFSRFNPAGTTVTLVDGPYGANTRLVLRLPTGTTLPADHYRLYMPNAGGTAINDIYGNQLDGEFLGNPATTGSDLNLNPAYEDLLPTGQYRAGMSGDSVAGGAYMTGFVVVPSGNLIYARPDYNEDPLLPSTTPDGSLAKPYPVLAPQAAPNSLNTPTLNNGDPNGGLNSGVNFLSGFNPTFDRAGIGRFARSAFYAASQLSSRGPVVVVALPGTPQRDPISGVESQRTFVLQAPAGSDPVRNDGSGSVPFATMLVFNPGSTLKLQNASLFVQNQGSSVVTLGGVNPNDRVNFTSYSNDAIAGDTNRDSRNTSPRAGDWGGIVFRNFQQQNRPNTFPVDVTLTRGPNGAPAVSGADDALSSINFANISFGGGAVPATQGVRYDEITLFNSRPAITNNTISGGSAGGGAGSQAGISADLDSFREDDLARGLLVRRTTVTQTSLNGIWVRPIQSTGKVEATNAIVYPDNPVTLGGIQNYTFDDPLPYVFTSVMDVGTRNVSDNLGITNNVLNRVYIQPGMLLKFSPGGGIRVRTEGSSMIVGDRTYIRRWDAGATIDTTTGLPVSNYAPTDANFRPNTTGDARVLFTTALDNAATTSFFDPLTGLSTTIVAPNDALATGGAGQPTPGVVPASSRWGNITYTSGSFGTFDEADLRYGGGIVNIPGGTVSDAGVLNFVGSQGGRFVFVPGQGFFFRVDNRGTRLSVTNNNFSDNLDVPMSIEPNGLFAADTLRPLTSGHPFFRGNIFKRNNGANGLLVKGGAAGNINISNVDVNSLWDHTDLTYIVRNSIVMGGGIFFGGGPGGNPPPTTLLAEPKPTVVLTVQSALPGTLLADGSKIPLPGESVIVKLDNRGVLPPSVTNNIAGGLTTEDNAAAGFIAGVDNGVDPTTDSTVDVGANSQMRFLGIGGNQTTGQQRVPVVITSIHDSTVGTTVRGEKLFTAIDGDTIAPKAGDGGLIYFGGNMLHDYSVLDPRGGSLMDNVDVRFITRIEMQGGGLVDYIDLNASNSFDAGDSPYATKGGVFSPLPNGNPDPRTFAVQKNTNNALMISNSNFSNFLDAGVVAHHGFNAIAGFTRSAISGQPNLLVMINNTISNMPIGVQMYGDINSDAGGVSPEAHELLLLNNTFFNNPIAVDLHAIAYAPGTPQVSSHIHFVAMDNIFSGSTTAVVRGTGMLDGSQGQYNLFHNSGPWLIQGPGDASIGAAPIHFGPANNNPVFGDPRLRDPANGDFQLLPDSAAIDASRSELNLNPSSAADVNAGIITALLPVVNQQLDATTGVRSQTSRVPDALGRFFFGGGGGGFLDPANPPTDVLTLPGYTDRGFVDNWVATLASDPQGIPGPTTVPGTWVYKPALIPAGTRGVPGGGERDQRGLLRLDNPDKPNVGFGSRPFFDIGAFEFVPVFPPHITGVTATVTDPSSSTGVSTINLYTVGGVTGTNRPIQSIQVQLDLNLDPTTVNGNTVLLQGSGGDAIFGNNNNPNDTFYNLSGKVAFDPSTNVLTVNIGAAGLTLQSDAYRLFVIGTGSQVIRDPQGNALDGENTVNGDPNGAQLALPSGDGFPGGNFYNNFVINNTKPSLVPGTFTLAPSSDTNVVGDKITFNNRPSFTGSIATGLSQITPVAGQTVIIDVATRGGSVFDRLNAGTAFTDAQGRFTVTVGQDAAGTGLVTDTSPLPDSPYNVGPDGRLDPLSGDDRGYTIVRVRVIDQSGNASNLPTDSLASYVTNNAVAGTVIDTAAPVITAFTPAPNSVLRADPTTGRLSFSFTANKNIDPRSLTANSIIVTRAGADGALGTADDVNVPIDTSSITSVYLANGPKGPQRVSFTVSGTIPNDQYAVTLKGAGNTPITDVAGTALAGAFTGTFPSGQNGQAGVDFNPVFVVFDPGKSTIRYVGDRATYATNPFIPATGARTNPFQTITAALAASTSGDVVGVLPGVYTEKVTLKPFVRILSSATSSSGSFFVVGNAQQTVLRAPVNTTTGPNNTVTAINIPSVPGVDTEIAGLSIASPLLFNQAFGPVDPNSVGVYIENSDVLVNRNYIVNAQIGINVVTKGDNAQTPRIQSNGIIGNTFGIVLDDSGNTTSLARLTAVTNNTIAFNTTGLQANNTANTPLQGALSNNIFWQNNDRTTRRNGFGVVSQNVNKLVLRNNLFQSNGASDTSPTFAGVNIGNGFVATNLKATPDALGNYVGNPAFVAPRDPRTGTGSDGPGVFFSDANFDLTSRSVAIDTANNAIAPTVDFRFRRRVDIAGRGFPGTGPADVGAFEFQGSGGVAAGGTFRVATTSLSADGAALANGRTFAARTAPASITVAFSDSVDRSSVSITDLLLTGTGLNAFNPAKPTSLAWVDDHTVKFNLTGGYSTSGSVKVTIPGGAVRSANRTVNPSFSDTFTISPTGTTNPSSVAAPIAAPTPVVTPAPAPSPQGPVRRGLIRRPRLRTV